jgi:hypothetical protein
MELNHSDHEKAIQRSLNALMLTSVRNAPTPENRAEEAAADEILAAAQRYLETSQLAPVQAVALLAAQSGAGIHALLEQSGLDPKATYEEVVHAMFLAEDD